jgi:hypothetical protein
VAGTIAASIASIRWRIARRPARFETLDERDGLIGREVAGNNAMAVDAAGKVWIGFLRGLTRYDPSLREANRVAPAVEIVSVAINGRPVNAPFTSVGAASDGWPTNGPLRLEHRQNNLRFEFRGLSFRDEGDVRYRY